MRFDAKKLGDSLREWRLIHNKGLREMARQLEMSPTTLSRIEAGNLPDMPTLDRILSGMDWKAGPFFGDTPTPSRNEVLEEAATKLLDMSSNLFAKAGAATSENARHQHTDNASGLQIAAHAIRALKSRGDNG